MHTLSILLTYHDSNFHLCGTTLLIADDVITVITSDHRQPYLRRIRISAVKFIRLVERQDATVVDSEEMTIVGACETVRQRVAVFVGDVETGIGGSCAFLQVYMRRVKRKFAFGISDQVCLITSRRLAKKSLG